MLNSLFYDFKMKFTRSIWQLKLCQSVFLILLCNALFSACQTASPPPTLEVKLYQSWELQAGDKIAGYEITGGLGDLSIDLNGQSIYTPFNGKTALDRKRSDCLYLDAAEIPAYRLRFCGVQALKLGSVQSGEAIATVETLQFATLQKQSNGTWAMVEPSRKLLEKFLQRL
jgi:hypothetical protein